MAVSLKVTMNDNRGEQWKRWSDDITEDARQKLIHQITLSVKTVENEEKKIGDNAVNWEHNGYTVENFFIYCESEYSVSEIFKHEYEYFVVSE